MSGGVRWQYGDSYTRRGVATRRSLYILSASAHTILSLHRWREWKRDGRIGFYYCFIFMSVYIQLLFCHVTTVLLILIFGHPFSPTPFLFICICGPGAYHYYFSHGLRTQIGRAHV